MAAALTHRGPDDSGVESLDGVHLVHRRLSVIDLSANGRQPMSNEDGSVWVTYNGELYGYAPLRRWLEGRGHRFRSKTDTEVLVHLYEELGPDMLPRLDGMFAFAIHDRRRRRLLLARDRVGIKPLFYSRARGEFLFASEIKAMRAVQQAAAPLRADAIGQYLLQGYVSAPDTVFHGISALPPGHYLDVSLDDLGSGTAIEPVEYWDAPFTGSDDRPLAEIQSTLEAHLVQAVGDQMTADVPLGAFLSGGVDSSAVVAAMARAGGRRVETFTVDLPGTDRSEGAKAAAVAEHCGTIHRQVDVGGAQAEQYWTCQHHFDTPFNCPSLLNASLISAGARKYVTVALSGDGGDELFGGYTRYLALQQPSRTPGNALANLGARWLPDDLRGRARLAAWGADDFTRAFTARHPMSVRAAERVAGTSLQNWVARMRAIYERHSADAVKRAQYLDLKTYLPDHVLAKVDSASMAVSLEVRVPLLSHRLVELAGGLPSNLLYRSGTGKWLLKQVVGPWLPAGVLDQPKTGFDPPLSSWLFDAHLSQRLDELSSAGAAFRRVIDAAPVDRWIRAVRFRHAWRAPRNSALWAVYQLERWLQGQAPPEAVSQRSA